MKKKQKQNGYVGLLLLLISLAIMVFMMWSLYFKKVPSGAVGGGKDTTVFEQNKEAIKSAENVKTLIEQQNNNTMQQQQ